LNVIRKAAGRPYQEEEPELRVVKDMETE